MELEKQVIISIGREFGSGGHVIAQNLAKKYEIPIYDYNLLREISDERDLDSEALRRYDEMPKNRLLSRTVRGYNNSPERNIAQMQFEYLRKKAEEGESFVVVGRCAETVLKDFDALISIFVLADLDKKIERTARCENISEQEAREMIRYYDRKRKAYHNYYCDMKWGDSRNYDLCINVSRLGLDVTTEIVAAYVEKRIENRQ